MKNDGKTLIDPKEEKERLRAVILAMRLLEDDYLGASGTRGYGKIKFQNITVKWRPIGFYQNPKEHPEKVLWSGDNLDDALVEFDKLIGDEVWGGKGEGVAQ